METSNLRKQLADLFYEYALNAGTGGDDTELSEEYANKAEALMQAKV